MDQGLPVVFRHLGIRFCFFSNEGDPREPLHVHAYAKLWLTPEVRVAKSVGFSRRDQAELVQVAEARRQEIGKAWHEHFGNGDSL